MNYGYFPGCSLEKNAAAYATSIRVVAEALSFGLDEIDDWNCCGATEYIALDKLAAYALVGRTLALAQQQLAGRNGDAQLVAPCSACFLNLRKADRYLQVDQILCEKTNEALAAGGLHYDPGALRVRHLLDILVNDIGCEAIKRRVTRPLTGLRVAPYYGCLLTRPRLGNELESTEFPMELDDLLAALGADVVDFPLKADCCGGHMTQISAPTAYTILQRLLASATDHGADMLAVLCPMCQLNLDAYQARVNGRFSAHFHLPVLYFTQLMGLAFGAEARALGVGQEIVSAAPVLRKLDAPPPKVEPPARKKRDDKALPMPQRR